MTPDLAVELINATVQLEQPLAAGGRTVGTGFLVSAPLPDGTPRTVLVTAAHVFAKMPGAEIKIGYRLSDAGGQWRYAPEALKVRDGDQLLYAKHPDRDVAVMTVIAPEAFARAAIPHAWLAERDGPAPASMGPGDEMFALGFPRGLSANRAGFPILRAGRVASYPITPVASNPTFLLDFAVFPGNSGGPVFAAQGARTRDGAETSAAAQPMIAGVLTQQVELKNERMEIGIVTHAAYVRETIALLDRPAGAASTLVAEAREGAVDAASGTVTGQP